MLERHCPPQPPPPQLAPLMEQRVEIYGSTRHDMNGKRGVATDFNPAYAPDGRMDVSQFRYSVKLDSGEAFRVRMAQVRAERTGAAGGARPKAKSKGKKARGKGGE